MRPLPLLLCLMGLTLLVGLLLASPSEAVPLTDPQVLVETAGSNETAPLLSDNWLVWIDDAGQGDQSPLKRLWARNLSDSQASDIRLVSNASTSIDPTLDAPWLAWASRRATGGDLIFVRNLETGETSTPLNRTPLDMVMSGHRLYYRIYNSQTFNYEVHEQNLLTGEGRVVLAPGGYFSSWTVEYPYLVWANFSDQANHVWLDNLSDENPSQSIVTAGSRSDIVELALGSGWVAWYNETNLSLTTLDGALTRPVANFSGYEGTGEWDFARDITIDGDFLTWVHETTNSTTYLTRYNGSLYHLQAQAIQPLLPAGPAAASNQTWLGVDRERFVWLDDKAATTDIWWREVVNLPPNATITSISQISPISTIALVAEKVEEGKYNITVVKVPDTLTSISVNAVDFLLFDAQGKLVSNDTVSDIYGYSLGQGKGVVFADNDFNGRVSPGDGFTLHAGERGDPGLENLTSLESFRFWLDYTPFTGASVHEVVLGSTAEKGAFAFFRGVGTDPDGTVVAYEWRSDLDGPLGIWASFLAENLSVGNHNITLRVRDDDGVWSAPAWQWLLVEPPNEPPNATIDSLSPSPATQGQPVTFNGSGSDSDGEVVAYEWRSNLSGFLSDQAGFTNSSLGVGLHNISLRVQDEDGAWSQWVWRDLLVQSPQTANQRPTATIISIAPNPVITIYTVTFNGTGTDPDGEVVEYRWESSISGLLSNQANFTTSHQAVGLHTITFSVRDNDGAWSEPVTQTLEIKAETHPPGPGPSGQWLAFSTPEAGATLTEASPVALVITPEGEGQLDKMTRVQLWLDASNLRSLLLYDSGEEPPDTLHGAPLFKPDSSQVVLPKGQLLVEELPNGYYTLRVEVLNPNGVVLSSTEVEVLVEHPRVAPEAAIGATAAGVAAGGALGALGGAGAAGAGGAGAGAGGSGGGGPQADGVGSRTRRRKTLKGGPVRGGVSLVLALTGLVLAYAYASLASPTLDPRENLAQLNEIVVADAAGFAADLLVMALFLGAVMAVVVIFRSWIDHLSAKAHGVKSVFRLRFPGLAALGLSTALFGMPFGYPAQSVHERHVGYEAREAKIALARIMGLLILVLPFWALWYLVDVSRYAAEIGLTVVLMSAFSVAIPLRYSEGRAIFRWKKGVALLLLLVLVGVFYGWQLDYLPSEVLPLLGLAGIAAMPGLLKPTPGGPLSEGAPTLDGGPPAAPAGKRTEPLPPEEEAAAYRPPEAPKGEAVASTETPPARGGWRDSPPGATGKGWADAPAPPGAPPTPGIGPPDEHLPEAPPLPDEPLPTGLPEAPEPPLGPPEPEAEAPKPEEPPAPPEAPKERQARACTSCGEAIDTEWKICPYCSAKQ